MTDPRRPKTTKQKLSVFRACFSGLTQVYGTYDPATGRVRQVKHPVTDQVILRHLRGQQPYGVYLLVEDRTRALAVDFDEDDVAPAVQFAAAAKQCGIAAYIERSKSKGYHVWVFFEAQGVLAAHARGMAQYILDQIGLPNTEVFPKQDRLDTNVHFGNFINAPLFGKLVPQGRTVFLDPSDPTQICSDQWELLANVEKVPGQVLDNVVEVAGLARVDRHSRQRAAGFAAEAVHASFGLPPCAQTMLAQGVAQYQRVACFRLAVHLRKAGLPLDMTRSCLAKWATKNRPGNGKRRITQTEIGEQTNWAYQKDYRGCGCEDPAIQPYCHSACPLKAKSAQM